MKLIFKISICRVLLGLFLLISHSHLSFAAENTNTNNKKEKVNIVKLQHLKDQILVDGEARLLVGLQVEPVNNPGNALNAFELDAARLHQVETAQQQVLENLESNLNRSLKNKRFKQIPFMAITVDESALDLLLDMPDVLSIEEDKLHAPTLINSIPQIGANLVWDMGYTGAGQAVAILDTGVESSHSFLSGKVVAEACYSSTTANSTALCTSGSTAPGSGANCVGTSGCYHGTHVAGIAAGTGGSFSGVARAADIIAIQVFSRFSAAYCGGSPCLLTFTSDYIQGLEYVYSLRNTYNIAAANMSLGGGGHSTAISCDNSNSSVKAIVDLLRSVDIATVIASGNGSSATNISRPGCISSAISVGAVNSSDQVASFSNAGSWLNVLAPGVSINSSLLSNTFGTLSGTSMATPHIAGAFAVFKSQEPNATVDQILAAINIHENQVLDFRNGLFFSEIDMAAASDALQAATLPVNLILDNDYSGVVQSGSFSFPANISSAYAGTSLNSTSGGASYRFTPDFPLAGQYRVYGWWDSAGGFAYTNQASYNIKNAANVQQVIANQQLNGGRWNELGVFDFNDDGSEYIEVVNAFGGTISADAVRFELITGSGVDPLIIDTSSLTNATVGIAYNASLSASGGVPPYSWVITAGNLPSGLSLSTAGVISGTPVSAGLNNFTVQVTDDENTTQTKGLSINVTDTGSDVVFYDDFEDANLAPWSSLFSSSVSVVQDSDNNWVMLKSGQDDPDGGWAPLDSAVEDFELVLYTKRINNNSGRANRYSLTDSNGNGFGFYLHFKDSKLTIEKRTAWAATSLIKSSALSGGANLNTWYTMRLKRTGSQLEAEVFNGKVDPENASPVLQVSASDSSFPSVSQVNINGGLEFYTDEVIVRDKGNEVLPLVINTTVLDDAVVGQSYNATLVASGGVVPYTWSIDSGSLPAGLLLSNSGVISGTATTSGLSNFSVKVTDNVGSETVQALSIQTNNAGGSIVFSDDFDSGSLINWSQLMSGNVQLVNNQGNSGYLRKTTNNDPNGGWVPLDTSVGDFDLVLHTRRVSASGGGKASRYSLSNNSGDGYGFYFHYNTNDLVIEKRSAWSASELVRSGTISGGAQYNAWYTMRFVRQGTSLSVQLFLGKVDPSSSTPDLELNTTDASFNSYTQFNVNGGYEFDTDDILIKN